VAVRVLEALDANGIAVTPDAIIAGLTRPDWPGRLDLRRLPDGREALLDAAHNPAGAEALASYLRESSMDRPPLVFAAMRDKDVGGMLRPLVTVVGPIVMTRASNARSADPDLLAETARDIDADHPVSTAVPVRAALASAWRSSPRIVVAGSIFLLGDVLKEFADTI